MTNIIKEIKELKESKPDGEFRTGMIINKIGYKWVHVLNLYNSKIEKINIKEFYNTYC